MVTAVVWKESPGRAHSSQTLPRRAPEPLSHLPTLRTGPAQQGADDPSSPEPPPPPLGRRTDTGLGRAGSQGAAWCYGPRSTLSTPLPQAGPASRAGRGVSGISLPRHQGAVQRVGGRASLLPVPRQSWQLGSTPAMIPPTQNFI